MKYVTEEGKIVDAVKAEYAVKRHFLWVYKVVNTDTGHMLCHGNQYFCEALVSLLNAVWQNGYLHGKFQTGKE